MDPRKWKTEFKVGVALLTLVTFVVIYKYRASRKRQNDSKKNDNNVARDSGPSFDPQNIQSQALIDKPAKLPDVEQMGIINLQTLNEYKFDHPNRLLLCVFGTVFDVTLAPDKYGTEGAYKDFAGHDITLALGSGKLEVKWLDRFVKMSDKQKESARGWMVFYEGLYPVAGRLDVWDQEQAEWAELTNEEMEELNAECVIM